MQKLRHKVAGFALGLAVVAGALAAEPPVLNPSHPERYVVQEGDNLWDISGRFLRDPWLWPHIWQANPQIENPHLIYPGDVLVLSYEGGAPRLSLQPGAMRQRKLSPEIRRTPLEEAIPAIPIDAIRSFLSRSHVATPEELRNAAYVAGIGDQRTAGATGDRVYVRNMADASTASFEVYRPGPAYKDPDTGEILGYEALFVSSAELVQTGDPATLILKASKIETIPGDLVFPDTAEVPLQAFHPKPPDRPLEGRIISVLDGVTQIGQYQTVAINRGSADGLQPGDVLEVLQGGFRVRDRARETSSFTVPLERAGILMIYRSYPRVSFGLIMRATRPLHVYDTVRSPEA